MPISEGNKKISFFFLALIILVLAMVWRMGPELADDGAFFLRYAQNMADGNFWVWNKGEAPVWGASAPLYPLLIALPISLGLPPLASMVWMSIALGAFSFAGTGLLLYNRIGPRAGVAFVALAAMSTNAMYFSGSGLETPLTFALLTLALWALLSNAGVWMVGLVAGLLMIQKLDLVPVGGLLLLAYWLKTKRLPLQSFALASILIFGWHGFAWWYFGAPVPNSFLTKALHQEDQPKTIDWRWFGGLILVAGTNKFLSLFTIVAFLRRTRELAPVCLFLGGLIVTHLVAYTIKLPFEPYDWYGMPSVYALLVLGAIGIFFATDYFAKTFFKEKNVQAGIAAILILLVGLLGWRSEHLKMTELQLGTSDYEFDRSEAGRWVNENTPKSFVVFTMWGNPAYYSQRKVLDGSFLNRKYESGDLIKKYRPEILVLQNNPGSTPMNPVFGVTKGEGYKIVKILDRTLSHGGKDYFFVVLAREDVLDKIKNVELPRNLMNYVQNIRLGDRYGQLNVHDIKTLFVHPGFTTQTRFAFDATAFAQDGAKKSVSIEAKIAPIPEDALKRGAGVVKLMIFRGGEKLMDEVVRPGMMIRKEFDASDAGRLEFVVDNFGNPDTDWLLLSMQ